MEKKIILDIILNDKKKVNASKAKESYMFKNHKEVYDYLSNYYNIDITFNEKVWLFINDLEKPKGCLVCGNATKFISIGQGYKETCSRKCGYANPKRLEKIEKTCLERYGTTNAAKSKEVKEKMKNTNIERYGNVCSLRGEEVKEKTKQTNLKNHGVEYPAQSEEIRKKAKETNLEKYGHEYPTQSEEVKKKIKETNIERYGNVSSLHGEEVKEKTKQTNLNNHGVEHVFQSEEIRKKAKETNLEKYGHEYPTQSDEVKEKTKQTNLKKHGVEYIFQSEEVKEKTKQTNLEKYGHENIAHGEKIKEKIKETNLERYGFENAAKSDVIKDKTKDTNIERYGGVSPMSDEKVRYKVKATNLKRHGVHYTFQSEKIKEKIKTTNINRYGFDNLMKTDKMKHYFRNIYLIKRRALLISYGIKDENIRSLTSNKVEVYCDKCNKNYTSSQGFIRQRLYLHNVEPCINCNPIGGSSFSEKELVQFIKDNYKGLVIENDRNILDGKELDVYLPDLKLAFEFNGVYWHNELFKNKDYHLNKTNGCLDKDVHLIHIYEDDWNYKKFIVKSRILNLLGNSKKIYARKCVIKEVDSKECMNFLDDNHIQGKVNSKVKLGLYYNDELVSLMTFGGLRKNLGNVVKEGSYELLRFCNILNTTVIGGASRLFNYFKMNYLPLDIISYADRSWSKGGLYINLGFKHVKNTGINYHYVVDGIRENRFKYRKDILVKEGYNKNKTEHIIMLDRDICRIYDSGSMKFQCSLT